MGNGGRGTDLLSRRGFSVSLHGRASGMSGLVLSDGCQRLPNVTWYDRSPKVRAIIAREIEFQLSKHVTPETRERAKKAQSNFRKPPPTDVQAHFSGEGRIGDGSHRRGMIRIVGRRGQRNLTYEYNPQRWEHFERATEAALRAILSLS